MADEQRQPESDAPSEEGDKEPDTAEPGESGDTGDAGVGDINVDVNAPNEADEDAPK
jgi:hypothetical protein